VKVAVELLIDVIWVFTRSNDTLNIISSSQSSIKA